MHETPAKKSLGQNFLTDRRYLAPILEAAELTPTDNVLEIGPGRGVLTEALASRVGCLVAVELDDRLIEPLRQRFAGQPHVHIVHGDILEHAPDQLVATARLTRTEGSEPDASERFQSEAAPSQSYPLPLPFSYKVVANLPYYITSAALRHLLEAERPPSLAVLMVQWEVAQRICAGPGEMSLLAVSVQYYAEPRIVQRVPARAFSPKPKVDSAVLQLRMRSRPAVDVAPERFFRVARAGFGQKRKQLVNTLAAGLRIDKQEVQRWLKEAGIDPTRRAETLTLKEWGALCQQAPL
ncbi:MAG: 16S rRNA (adenine(1518)-N(6)/adenine(1519)-N(6))-dimethyltransferase RsmA [Caldilinea sp.]|nr:16S rRNA (adenine(1518)-N(6)/adenine(1519)-N(6))-dimethyltransferase RsmA [Caldilinea sp.]MDW8442514.1 16S rRNA (adenine(1518)-N(6)/adenine(1519)-N(6))-dimethyltransferase RsmA [Caldilineaceae bacterium]